MKKIITLPLAARQRIARQIAEGMGIETSEVRCGDAVAVAHGDKL